MSIGRKPPEVKVATVSSDEWNKTVSKIRQGRLPVSRETSMGSGGNLPQGRIPNAYINSSIVQHPFTIIPSWNGDIKLHGSEIPETGRNKGCWCLTIRPGFLNGHPPAIRMWTEDIPGGAPIWANDYGNKSLGPGNHHSVLLTDDYTPFIKCTNLIDTRAKVYGADGFVTGGEVPTFFRARGAKRPTPLDFFDFITNVLAVADAEAASIYLMRLLNGSAPAYILRDDGKDIFPEGNRYLYQADIILQVDRPTVVQRFEPDDIGLLRYAGFDIELPTRDDYSARIFEVPIYIPPKKPTYWDIIYGTYREYVYDELVLARFFLLSPTEEFLERNSTGNPKAPDGTWLPFVRHNVYWNLNYSSIQQIDTFTHDTSLEWFKQILGVLAGGVAWLFAVSVVNPIEATYDQINTAFNQTAVKGQFWTG